MTQCRPRLLHLPMSPQRKREQVVPVVVSMLCDRPKHVRWRMAYELCAWPVYRSVTVVEKTCRPETHTGLRQQMERLLRKATEAQEGRTSEYAAAVDGRISVTRGVSPWWLGPVVLERSGTRTVRGRHQLLLWGFLPEFPSCRNPYPIIVLLGNGHGVCLSLFPFGVVAEDLLKIPFNPFPETAHGHDGNTSPWYEPAIRII